AGGEGITTLKKRLVHHRDQSELTLVVEGFIAPPPPACHTVRMKIQTAGQTYSPNPGWKNLQIFSEIPREKKSSAESIAVGSLIDGSLLKEFRAV
ncbi:MAG: hypothetical protein AAF497_27775, partial [Planctomycetota bacterium]